MPKTITQQPKTVNRRMNRMVQRQVNQGVDSVLNQYLVHQIVDIAIVRLQHAQFYAKQYDRLAILW